MWTKSAHRVFQRLDKSHCDCKSKQGDTAGLDTNNKFPRLRHWQFRGHVPGNLNKDHLSRKIKILFHIYLKLYNSSISSMFNVFITFADKCELNITIYQSKFHLFFKLKRGKLLGLASICTRYSTNRYSTFVWFQPP